MALSVRTDPKQDAALSRVASRLKVTKSEVVKRAIDEYVEKHGAPKATPWELLQDLLADVERSFNDDPNHVKLPADLSVNRKKYLDEYYAESAARRRGAASGNAQPKRSRASSVR